MLWLTQICSPDPDMLVRQCGWVCGWSYLWCNVSMITTGIANLLNNTKTDIGTQWSVVFWCNKHKNFKIYMTLSARIDTNLLSWSRHDSPAVWVVNCVIRPLVECKYDYNHKVGDLSWKDPRTSSLAQWSVAFGELKTNKTLKSTWHSVLWLTLICSPDPDTRVRQCG